MAKYWKILNHNIFVSLYRNNHHNHQNKYFRACTKGDLEEVKASLKEMKKEGLGKKKESKAVEAEKKALAKESGVPAGIIVVCLHFDGRGLVILFLYFSISNLFTFLFQMVHQWMMASLQT